MGILKSIFEGGADEKETDTEKTSPEKSFLGKIVNAAASTGPGERIKNLLSERENAAAELEAERIPKELENMEWYAKNFSEAWERVERGELGVGSFDELGNLDSRPGGSKFKLDLASSMLKCNKKILPEKYQVYLAPGTIVSPTEGSKYFFRVAGKEGDNTLLVELIPPFPEQNPAFPLRYFSSCASTATMEPDKRAMGNLARGNYLVGRSYAGTDKEMIEREKEYLSQTKPKG